MECVCCHEQEKVKWRSDQHPGIQCITEHVRTVLVWWSTHLPSPRLLTRSKCVRPVRKWPVATPGNKVSPESWTQRLAAWQYLRRTSLELAAQEDPPVLHAGTDSDGTRCVTSLFAARMITTGRESILLNRTVMAPMIVIYQVLRGVSQIYGWQWSYFICCIVHTHFMYFYAFWCFLWCSSE